MDTNIHLSDEVNDALNSGGPLVALESTLITHGLPYPANVQTALEMEAAVRAQGAVPATIAVLKGKITVGITPDDIERLGKLPTASVRKCSRRDLPIAVGLQEDGATTVAGTMIVAHRAGIRLFATGGIGGVHRGQPFDVSADLIELGRTPVAVVCSGAKSILDLPLTLEVLETQGVPVIGFGTDMLPAFYSRRTELHVDVCLETPREVAQVIEASWRLALGHGVLITVPVPAGDELPGSIAETAIQQATLEAQARGIHGKEITPFVLSRVAELTEGLSRRANTALLVNNARVAAQIAVELTK